jgi:hypothetical protein
MTIRSHRSPAVAFSRCNLVAPTDSPHCHFLIPSLSMSEAVPCTLPWCCYPVTWPFQYGKNKPVPLSNTPSYFSPLFTVSNILAFLVTIDTQLWVSARSIERFLSIGTRKGIGCGASNECLTARRSTGARHKELPWVAFEATRVVRPTTSNKQQPGTPV